MAEFWRCANLGGALAVYTLLVAAGALYGARYRALKLGRRRMVPPRVKWLGYLTVAIALLPASATTIDHFGEPLRVWVQLPFSATIVAAHAWLLQVIVWEMRLSPSPMDGGLAASPAIADQARLEDEAFEDLARRARHG